MTERSSGHDAEHTTPAPPKRKGWGRVIKRTILLTLLLVTATAGVMIYLARATPEYYKAHERFLAETTPKQIEQLADQVEDKLEALANLGIEQAPPDDPASQTIKSLTDPDAKTAGGGDPEDKTPAVKPEDVHINTQQTITLNNEQLAAVVQLRLDEWMTERGYVKPDEVQDPLITVNNGDLVMAFKFNAGKLKAVISGKFLLVIRDDGMAELSLKRFLVGKLPVPADALGDHLREKSGGDSRAAKVGEWLGKLQHVEVKPVIELEHRRRARVMDYKILDDSLELTVRIQDHKTYKAMNSALAGVPVN